MSNDDSRAFGALLVAIIVVLWVMALSNSSSPETRRYEAGLAPTPIESVTKVPFEAEQFTTDTPPPSRRATVAAEASAIATHLVVRGLEWHAGVHEISLLTYREQRQRLGLLPGTPPPDERSDNRSLRGSDVATPTLPSSATPSSAITATRSVDRFASRETMPSGLPRRLDYRPILTSIRNQGACGSCWAFTAIAVMEAEMRLVDPDVPDSLDLSEQRLVSCRGNGCDGAYIPWALQQIVDNGATWEQCNEYEMENQPARCDVTCVPPRLEYLSDYGLVADHRTSCSTSPDARPDSWNQQVMAALYDHGPLAARMSIPRDFYWYDGGIYRFSDYFKDDSPGCHAVVMVGYDAAERYWIIENSWGTDWGEEGFARISWDDTRAHVGGSLYWVSYGSPTPTATARPSVTMQPTRVPTDTPRPTATDEPYPEPSTATFTPMPTVTPRPTPTATPPATLPPYPYPNPYP